MWQCDNVTTKRTEIEIETEIENEIQIEIEIETNEDVELTLFHLISFANWWTWTKLKP